MRVGGGGWTYWGSIPWHRALRVGWSDPEGSVMETLEFFLRLAAGYIADGESVESATVWASADVLDAEGVA